VAGRAAQVQVQGAAELRRTLRRAGDDLGDMKDVNAAVARLVATRSVASGPRRSGKLVASVRGSRAVSSAVVRAGGARVPYAGPIHWGWPSHHIAAHPFIADTAVATEPTWTRMYLQGINEIIGRVRGA